MKNIIRPKGLRIINTLLNGTGINVRFEKITTRVNTEIGFPQGDGLSPILFVVYLKAALRASRFHLKSKIILGMIYADDIDLIVENDKAVKSCINIINKTFQKWNLRCNLSKTEVTNLEISKDESWRLTKKLGSLLGAVENSKKRQTISSIAFEKLLNLWKKAERVSERRKINLYKALVFPILTYNCGIWALKTKSWQLIDAHHRKILKKLMGITYPRVISNKTLHEKTKSTPISQHSAKIRWSLLGHILKSDENLPARKAIEIYFKNIETTYPGFRGRPRITLPTVLPEDLKRAETIASRENHKIPLKLSTMDDLTELRKIKKRQKTMETSR